MAYLATSTFVTFPNGEVQDVAGCGQTFSGTTLLLTRAGQTVYQYQFDTLADLYVFVSTVGAAMRAFNMNPAEYFLWSLDAEMWESGPIPVNLHPNYLQIFGPGVTNATLVTVTDASGRVFNLTVEMVSSSAIVAGPFNQAGTNTPAIGNATIVIFKGTAIIGSLPMTFGPPVVQSVITGIKWSTDDATWQNLPIIVETVFDTGFYLQVSGSALPLSGTMTANGFNLGSPTSVNASIASGTPSQITSAFFVPTAFDPTNGSLSLYDFLMNLKATAILTFSV